MKLIKYLFIILVTAAFVGCQKDDVIQTDTQVGHSKITYFPVLTMAGNPAMSVVKGTAFTDPGVTATEGGSIIPVKVSGTVNTNTVGFYALSYSATNKDGFSKTIQRIVIVIPEAEKPGVDLSGEYLPIGGAPANAMITKLDKGIYYTTNCWGGGSLAVIPAYFICTDGATVTIPVQDLGTGAGRIKTEGSGTYVNGLISWTVTRLDFPGGALTRDKKWQKL